MSRQRAPEPRTGQLTPGRPWRAVAAGGGSAGGLVEPFPGAGRIALSPAALRALIIALLAATAAVGVALRFVPAGALWFDEVQAVAIAREPLGGLFHALRQDGSPPLYYLVLHGWMALFGSGTGSVRAMSGLFSAVSLPFVWLLARRLLSRPAALAALVLVATSPMAIRYALEARMYAMEPLLVALAGLALFHVLERPSWPRVALVSLLSGLLALTHYWLLFLLAAVALALAWPALRGSRPHRRALLGVVGGAVVFLPWLPSMLFQITHTGTPWSHAAIYEILEAIPAFGGADEMTNGLILPTAAALVPILLALVVHGARRGSGVRPIVWVTVATLAAAGLTSVAVGAAIVPRYITAALLPYLFVAGAGVAALPPRWRDRTLVLAAVLGVFTGYLCGIAPRTIAPQVADTLVRYGQPTDTVVYCPDQLGPDVARLLPSWSRQQVFPTGGRPGRVDWVNYETRNLRSHPSAYARSLTATAGRHPVWLLSSNGFVEYHGRCGQLGHALGRLRPSHRQMLTGSNPMDPTQSEVLTEYLPSAAGATAAGRG